MFAAPDGSSTYPPDTGVPAILAYPGDSSRYLVIERTWVSGAGFKIRLFDATTRGATDVQHIDSLKGRKIVPMRKKLVADLADFGLSGVYNTEAWPGVRPWRTVSAAWSWSVTTTSPRTRPPRSSPWASADPPVDGAGRTLKGSARMRGPPRSRSRTLPSSAGRGLVRWYVRSCGRRFWESPRSSMRTSPTTRTRPIPTTRGFR
ncbi:esterase-like activity of phytase family protein [Streptomyces microflavus]|uniref:esterase-like activity of phytase family protein n=1 Tax=Streptomyces microflavus TaxID=1919 RepID=UPI00380D2581